MDAIKVLKDAIDVIQKSNDIDLIQKLISAQQEVIDMQEKMYKLQVENNKLKEAINKKDNVVRYRSVPIISLKDDEKKVLYCANCYGAENKLIQLHLYDDKDSCTCRICKDRSFISNSPDADLIREGLD